MNRYKIVIGAVVLILLNLGIWFFLWQKPTQNVENSNAITTDLVHSDENKSSSIDIEMVFVEGGTFQKGVNGMPGHEFPVTVNGFSIGKYEVTQAQWKAVMGSNPSRFQGCDNCPVENVSLSDMQQFIYELNIQTGKKYRLPTEAEWEYAARGGNQTKGYRCSGSNGADKVAWYSDNGGRRTHPVGSKLGNELGIYDMSGNVEELCTEWNGDNPRFRGGSYAVTEQMCHTSFLGRDNPAQKWSDSGFRIILPVIR